ncbi:MAG: hypothetical protein U5J96_04000 [Ignavibacteriaceae bacterium]|nr:hypothetical protein [Ignavibacteriaceae bacterium]
MNDDITTTDQWMPTIAVTPNGTKIGIFTIAVKKMLLIIIV